MRHDQLQVISYAGDVEVDQSPIILGQLQSILCLFNQVFVHAGVAHVPTYVGLDHA